MRMGAELFTSDEWQILEGYIWSADEDAADRILDAIQDACEAIQARRQTLRARP